MTATETEVAGMPGEGGDRQTELALALFTHLEEQINRTDTKAQVVLAVDALLLGWFSTQNPTVVRGVLAQPAFGADWLGALLTLLVFFGLFLSLACGLVVIWPRVGKTTGSTAVYFGDIARQSERDYTAAMLRQSPVEMLASVLAGVHAKARIARAKYRWVGLSLAFLLASLVLLGAVGVLHAAAA